MNDKYLWLEEVLSDESLTWARKENEQTLASFESLDWFKNDVNEIQKILDTKDKIPFISFIVDEYVYNFWTDEQSIQGLLRRTTIENYKKENTNWETLIDFDLLSKNEAQKWVYHGFEISPNKKRALVFLSPGGTDADVGREFDIETKSFVKNGFDLPVSKGSASWLNDDELFVFRDFGAGSLTVSGYPRIVKRWKRGEKLEVAKTIFEIAPENNAIWLESIFSKGESVALATKSIDFYLTELYRFDGIEFKQMSLPKKYESYDRGIEGFFLGLNEDWLEFKMGDVLYYNYITEKAELVYRPEEKTSVYVMKKIKDGILGLFFTDVKAHLSLFTKNNGKWEEKNIETPKNGSLEMLVTTPESNDYFIAYSSFNTPSTYYYGNREKLIDIVKRQPGYFNYENIEVHQHFATSSDGVKVPYFLIHQKGLELNAKNPTILYGYGGFEIPLKPYFSNVLGKGWLDKGGVYVLANIRGGGEYGPRWHQAALKGNRQCAYNDFYAIAEDLFSKKITSPQHLGAQGGSNGGLLMGVCYTQRPDLFAAINCMVPLLDMHRYHKLLAGHSWVAEYGNPDDEKDGAYIRKISPYHQIKKEEKNYPKMYLNTSTKDDRVHPGHARKFAAKLKEYGLDYFYYENIDGGHAGASNSKEAALMRAMDYAFFWLSLKK